MRRTELLQEIRAMRFEEVYFGWTERRLSQEEAARIGGHAIGRFDVILIDMKSRVGLQDCHADPSRPVLG